MLWIVGIAGSFSGFSGSMLSDKCVGGRTEWKMKNTIFTGSLYFYFNYDSVTHVRRVFSRWLKSILISLLDNANIVL